LKNNKKIKIAEIQNEIIDEFSVFDDWMDKYNYLIDLGNDLPEIAEEYKTQEYIIEGCQSKVWVNAELNDGSLLTSTRSDAIITKGRASISSIRSAIVSERQTRLISGDSTFIAGTSINNGGLFAGVLMYPINSGSEHGDWSASGTSDANTSSYNYNASGVNVLFTYTRSNGKFTCSTSNGTYGTQCLSLIK